MMEIGQELVYSYILEYWATGNSRMTRLLYTHGRDVFDKMGMCGVAMTQHGL